MKQDANDIHRQFGDDGLRHAFDEAAHAAMPNGHASGERQQASDSVTPSISVLSSAEFVRGFCPPDYVVDGIAQRGFLYSLTGATGSGKTAIALRLLACTALGRELGGRAVQQGPAVM